MHLSKSLQAALFLPLSMSLVAGEEVRPPAGAPHEGRRRVEVQTAQLFSVNNVNDYHLSAQYLSVVYRVRERAWQLGGFRATPELLLSAIGEAVLHGPESHYFGGAVRGRLVFSRPASNWSLYLEGGAGAGVIDSTGPPAGQGQDFTFNLLAGGGVRCAFAERWTVALGIQYQHLSNGGLSEPESPNIGMDAYGPSLTVGMAF